MEGTKEPEKGQAIMIHACKIGGICAPNGPSLATEFFEQVELSAAPNGCVLLPGHMQFWTPCYHKDNGIESKGTKEFDIREPIHFCGPEPGAAPSKNQPAFKRQRFVYQASFCSTEDTSPASNGLGLQAIKVMLQEGEALIARSQEMAA